MPTPGLELGVGMGSEMIRIRDLRMPVGVRGHIVKVLFFFGSWGLGWRSASGDLVFAIGVRDCDSQLGLGFAIRSCLWALVLECGIEILDRRLGVGVGRRGWASGLGVGVRNFLAFGSEVIGAGDPRTRGWVFGIDIWERDLGAQRIAELGWGFGHVSFGIWDSGFGTGIGDC
jgi:hypothetical protein